MRDPEGVEPGGVAPDAFQELVVDLVRAEGAEWAAGRLGQGEQRVALGRHPGRHDREHRDPGPLGQQGDEGLLDLGPAAQREVGSVAPVPQRRPGGGQQLAAVPGVPAEDLHQQRAPAWPLGGDRCAPRGSSGPWRIPLASTPRSARASATWATVRRPVGEPNSR